MNIKKEPRYTTTYLYDGNSNLTLKRTETPKGILKHKFEYEYDSENRLISEIKTGKDDRFLYHYEYEYDGAGRQISILSYGSQGQWISQQSFVYDDQGNKISHRHTYFFDGKEGYATQTDYQYNKKGNMVKESYYDRTGKLHSVYLNSYLKDGTLEKTVFQDAKGNTWETIEYDAYPDDSPKEKKVTTEGDNL